MSNGKTICTVCNYIYDEALGDQTQNVPPAVKFGELPEDWRCPDCGSTEDMFQPCSCVSLHIYEQTCMTTPKAVQPTAISRFAEMSVGQLVAEHPELACVLEQFDIEYCCGGKMALYESCKQQGASLEKVLDALNLALHKEYPLTEQDWTKASLSELIEHIVSSYHEPLRKELPRLAGLAEKVAKVHGNNHPEMVNLFRVFKTFREQLELHMQKEELILFPGISSIEAGANPKSFGCGGGIEHPIEMMSQEHDEAGEALATMRKLANDYVLPKDACDTFKILLHSLAKLELDMHQHVHKENNILFPRALASAQCNHKRATSHS